MLQKYLQSLSSGKDATENRFEEEIEQEETNLFFKKKTSVYFEIFCLFKIDFAFLFFPIIMKN